MPRPLRLLLGGLAASLALFGCDTGDGRTLEPPDTTEAVAAAATTTSSLPADVFTVVITDLGTDGDLPAEYTRRDGFDTSPPIRWSGVPEGTQELALVVTDETADGFVHWVLAGIDPTSVGLEPGQVPPGAVQAVNDFGDLGYGGPAPPGDGPHSYVVRLHALDQLLQLEDGLPADEALARIAAATTATTETRAVYE